MLRDGTLCRHGGRAALACRMTAAGKTFSASRAAANSEGDRRADRGTRSPFRLFCHVSELSRTRRHGPAPAAWFVRDRLEVLQRIFEHELLHLVEFLTGEAVELLGSELPCPSWRIFGPHGERPMTW